MDIGGICPPGALGDRRRRIGSREDLMLYLSLLFLPVVVLLLARSGRTGAAARGAQAEVRVAEVLQGLGERHAILANRVVPGRAGRAPEVDLLVVRADAVFTVEVKSSLTPLTLTCAGMYQQSSRAWRRLRDPKRQAENQARSARRFLAQWRIDVPVFPAVVVLAPAVTCTQTGRVRVYRSAAELREAILRTQPRAGRGGDPLPVLRLLPRQVAVRP